MLAVRELYQADCKEASRENQDDVVVTTIDFAQNVGLPHSTNTPSSWYFLSLISVSVFGAHSYPGGVQTNFVYSERKAGKGSNAVISLLDTYAVKHGIYTRKQGEGKKWVIYADNCGGQNKNNAVLKYLLFLAQSKCLESVSIHFLVKGHTKNHCDRGFGNLKRRYAREDVWTLEQLETIVADSASTNECANVENDDDVFRDFKSPLNSLYSNVNALQSYQLFSMSSSEPGVVLCREDPNSQGDKQTVLVSATSRVNFTADEVDEFWASALAPLEPPKRNSEKIVDIYKKVLPSVPAQHRSDPLYIVPTPDDLGASSTKKRGRAKPKKPDAYNTRRKKLLKLREAQNEEESKG